MRKKWEELIKKRCSREEKVMGRKLEEDYQKKHAHATLLLGKQEILRYKTESKGL